MTDRKSTGMMLGAINVSSSMFHGHRMGLINVGSSDGVTIGLINFANMNSGDVLGNTFGLINIAEMFIGSQFGLINFSKISRGDQYALYNQYSYGCGIKLGLDSLANFTSSLFHSHLHSRYVRNTRDPHHKILGTLGAVFS